MSSLTDEQRKRIEENRLKALQRRAAAASAQSIGNGVVAPFSNVKSIPQKPPPIYNKSTAQVSSTSNTAWKSLNSFSNKNSSGKSQPVSTKTSQSDNIFSKPSQAIDVKGTCVLHSRQRFYVNVRYHKQLIEEFKKIPSKMYDVQSKKWNFLIEDHDKLLAAVKPLQPEVFLVSLPRLVLKTFSSVTENRIIKEHDLSRLDPVLLKALLPFQKEGVNFAIQHGGRVLVADDMGLGKTIQAIAIANYYSKDWPLLVITPSSVRYSWEEAFHKWLPSVDPSEISIINTSKDHIPDNKIILMSYDLLNRMKDIVIKRHFKSIILDESHFLKSHKSARTKAAQDVMKHITRIIMLTGTPALSRPMELFTQISALKNRDFFGFKEYGIRYCNGKEQKWGWDFNGSSNMEELQLLLEETIMIRRLKSEVIKQLPAKFRQMVVLDPSRVSSQTKVMKAMSLKMQDDRLKGGERRGALLEYFHQTGEVKLKAVCEYILDLLESDKKFIVFAHHQNVLNGICNILDDKKLEHIRIDGSVTSERRKHLCDRFQVSDACRVAVLSITSANCGITLTAASLVVFAELFWNPGILTQAEDRAHRIGQEDSVVVQYLVARGTADDEIWPLVQRKLDVLNKAGLSKDNFKSADTIMKEDWTQPCLDDFWGELEDEVDLNKNDCQIPEKRLKLDDL